MATEFVFSMMGLKGREIGISILHAQNHNQNFLEQQFFVQPTIIITKILAVYADRLKIVSGELK